MKLRNKKTGEIIELLANPSFIKRNDDYLQSEVNSFNSLAELNEEWEDYEEPKENWYIDWKGNIRSADSGDDWSGEKSIGNHFETREEAEKAVEKLKAYKRLKDKGFRFTGVAGISNNIYCSFETDSKYRSGHVMYDEYSNTDSLLREYNEDLMLLFGGEE